MGLESRSVSVLTEPERKRKLRRASVSLRPGTRVRAIKPEQARPPLDAQPTRIVTRRRRSARGDRDRILIDGRRTVGGVRCVLARVIEAQVLRNWSNVPGFRGQ